MTEEYKSQNEEVLKQAREANNTWIFEEKELEKFVANGTSEVATKILNRKNKEQIGLLIHRFAWEKGDAFSSREAALTTRMMSVGRSKERDIDSAHLVSVDSEFYKTLVEDGTLVQFLGNGETRETAKSREEMIHHANIYPESASEAIETWLDAAKFEILEDDNSLDFVFEASETVKVLWRLGSLENPAAAAVFTFKSPESEVRRDFDKAVQKIRTRTQNDVNFSEVSQNFGKIISYGSKHLIGVEGIAVETEGQNFSQQTKEKFVILFNPVWFAKCVGVMHDSFDITEGKSAAI